MFDVMFSDPDTALGFVQVTVRRALTANDIKLEFEDDEEGCCIISYIRNDGVVISQYHCNTGTMSHHHLCLREQKKLINAHAALFD